MTISDHWLETYKALITISLEGFKFLALANGGSLVALLAYLGNIAGKGVPFPDMRYAMFTFISGLVCCGLSMFFAYLTQLKLLNEKNGGDKRFPHSYFLLLSILSFLGSLFAFGFGSYQAVNSFH